MFHKFPQGTEIIWSQSGGGGSSNHPKTLLIHQKRHCSIRVAKTKALISFAVTTKLMRICFRLCKLLVFSSGGSYAEDMFPTEL